MLGSLFNERSINYAIVIVQAVALKALAGVALIGAAAALASNPVLLPLGVLAGRKKREVDSYSSDIENIDVGDLAKLVENSVPEVSFVEIYITLKNTVKYTKKTVK